MTFSNLCPICKTGTLLPSKFGGAGATYCANYKSGCKYKGKGTATVARTGPATAIPVLATMSDEQRAGIVAAETGDDNMMFEALAGTGKTTEMVQLVRVFAARKLSVLTLAFAKRDQLALEERCCGQATVATSNAAGYRILSGWAKTIGCKRIQLDDSIPFTLLKTRLKAEGIVTVKDGKESWDIGRGVVSSVLDLVGKARSILPLSAVDSKLPKSPTEADYIDIMGRFGIEIDSDELPNVLSWSAWLFAELASLKTLATYGTDFAGQVFLPSYHNLKPSTVYDRVLVDEYQDQNYTTRRIIELYRKPVTGRVVVVGDRHQAIYGWRGADSDSMNNIDAMLAQGGEPKKFPLTICRRCSKAVIRDAQKLVPAIKALDTAPEGESVTIPTDADFIAELTKQRKGLVLCRANAPSVSICLRLLAAGVPAALVRSDIIGQLLKLIDKCSGGNDSQPVTDTLECINLWKEDQLAKLAKKPNSERMAQVVTDKAETIHALAMDTAVQTTGDLKKRIDVLFPKGFETVPMGERAAKIVLFSTVHGAKGGEAKTVYLYSPEKYKTCLWDAIWSDATDRDNVLYVGITRAEHTIVYAGKAPTLSRMSEG